MTDTEARDALAAAIRALHPDAHTVIVMAANVGETSTPDEFAAAILAALDGWTLVPVDTVVDAEAMRALPALIPFNRSVEITRRHGTTVWEVYVWNGDDLDGSDIRASLAAAVAAALGGSDG